MVVPVLHLFAKTDEIRNDRNDEKRNDIIINNTCGQNLPYCLVEEKQIQQKPLSGHFKKAFKNFYVYILHKRVSKVYYFELLSKLSEIAIQIWLSTFD